MQKLIKLLWSSFYLLLIVPVCSEASEIVSSERTIPFKEDGSMFMGAGLSIVVIIIFLVAVGLAFFYMRKNNIGQFANIDKDKQIEIIEIKRLSTKTIVFLLKVRDAEVFVAQSGDSVHSFQLGSNKE